MKRLELILLRAPGEALEPLCSRIRESITGGGDHEAEVTLYRRRGLSRLWSVLLLVPKFLRHSLHGWIANREKLKQGGADPIDSGR